MNDGWGEPGKTLIEGVIRIVRSTTRIRCSKNWQFITLLERKRYDLFNYSPAPYSPMPTAYVLINCDLGSEEEIIREIKKLQEAVEVSGVYGVYDIIAKIRSDSMDKLRETITWHVRRIDKVRSTLTMIVIEGQGEKKK
jgi:DNA-binding Lrp family transcriptional regulator